MLTKKFLEQYEEEVLKQTDSYEYFVTNMENRDKYAIKESNITCNNEGVHSCNPFFCVEENNTHKIYEIDGYYLYEAKNGYINDEEKRFLIEKAKKLNADLIYPDSDFVNKNKKRHTPFFKPQWSPDTYAEFDYITECYAIKKELNNTCVENINNIIHIEETLFHEESDLTSDDIYKELAGTKKSISYEEERVSEDENISIVIPSKDNPELINACLKSLEKAKIKSRINGNTPLEIIVVDNGSNEENKNKITDIIENISKDILNIKYIYFVEDFNFSNMCNIGVNASKGKYLLFMNDDIEVIDDMFLVKLLHYARKNHVGAVAPKLYYPDGDIIQHDGITDLIKCGPTHKLMSHSDSEVFYFGANRFNRNVLAVTGACLMVSREKFFLIGGFYDKMKVGYNDVDLCISLFEKGFYNVIVNDAVMYHHESVTRGYDSANSEKYLRLKKERNLLYERHSFLREKGDPFYNSRLIDDTLDYSVNVCPECNKRDLRSDNLSELHQKKAEKYISYVFRKLNRPDKHVHMNIENTEKVLGIFDEGNAFTVKGWALLNKKNNILYDRYLVIFSSDKREKENIQLFFLADKYREDVKTVFPDSKNSLLAGFVSSIRLKEIEKYDNIETLEFGILFVSKITGKKYFGK